MTNSNPKLDTEDHAWRAFRFLANEMSAEEIAEFEASLENDADLCESLLKTCALGESIYAVFDAESAQLPVLAEPDNRKQKAPALRRSSIWVSQMACLVAMVGVAAAFWFSSGNSADNLAEQYSQTEASELVELWESASEVNDSREFMVIAESDSEFSNGVDAVIEIEEVAGEQIPEWLLVALESEQNSVTE
jgi:hypothetical protein